MLRGEWESTMQDIQGGEHKLPFFLYAYGGDNNEDTLQ